MRALVFAVVLASASVASAQSGPSPEAVREAQAGQAAYDAGDFAVALGHFERAHALFADPTLTYNVARCHDRLGHAREAADAYRAYLDEAGDLTDLDRHDVEEAIRRNEAAAEPLPGPAPATTTAPSTDVGAAPAAEASGPGWPFWAATGVAVAGTALSVVFNFVALSEQKRLGCGTFDDWQACDRANRYTTLTLVAGGVALAAAGVALYLYLTED